MELASVKASWWMTSQWLEHVQDQELISPQRKPERDWGPTILSESSPSNWHRELSLGPPYKNFKPLSTPYLGPRVQHMNPWKINSDHIQIIVVVHYSFPHSVFQVYFFLLIPFSSVWQVFFFFLNPKKGRAPSWGWGMVRLSTLITHKITLTKILEN